MSIIKLPWRSFPQVDSLEQAVAEARGGRISVVKAHDGVKAPFVPYAISAGPGSLAFASQYAEQTSYWAPAVEYFVAPNVFFFKDGSLVVIGGRFVCEELDYECHVVSTYPLFSQALPLTLSDQSIAAMRSAVHVAGVTQIVHPKWHVNYTHWHTEGLVKILASQEVAGIANALAVPSLNAVQRASLTMLRGAEGVGPRRLLELTRPVYHLECAIISTLNLSRTWLHPVLRTGFERLRRCGLSHVEIRPGTTPLYASRLDTDMRRMTNERDLIASLKARGFEIVTTGELSYAQQVEAFARASLVVGPHGSALTNMIFSPPGTPLIELRPLNATRQSPFRDKSYWVLSSVLDHPYRPLFGENGTGENDWAVGIAAVLAEVDALRGVGPERA